MSSSAGPSIITNSLVLHLDAADRKSYPGSGTVWTDRSGNGNHGTLIGGAGYNSGNGGSLTFDGSNDYINCGNSSSIQLIDNMTVNYWFMPSNYSGGRQGLLGRNGLNEYTITLEPLGSVSFYFSAPSEGAGYFNGASSRAFGQENNVFQQLTIVRNYAMNAVYIYKNSLLTDTGYLPTLSKPIATSGPLTIGFGNGGFYNGRIASMNLYNRALTTQEIKQNFNATKSRFGLL
jgi:hypothetical protein